jgi:hypothetical protein
VLGVDFLEEDLLHIAFQSSFERQENKVCDEEVTSRRHRRVYILVEIGTIRA